MRILRFIKRRILRFGVDLRQILRVFNVDTGRNTCSETRNVSETSMPPMVQNSGF